MANEAMQELIRQAEEQAKKLENGAGPSAEGACVHHGELARGVSLSLRLQLVQARGAIQQARGGLWGLGASLGIPAPVCALLWAIGQAKGWW
jgi:hypothetical protein